jgi:heme-degrading monooxygenase HmoA
MTDDRARIVFLVHVPNEWREAFLAAYSQIRYAVADGVPGHLRDQVCQAADDPEEWLITSEWERVEDFLAWERSPEHRDLVRPLRECITTARSLRFRIVAETVRGGSASAKMPSANSASNTASANSVQAGRINAAG